MCEHVPVLSWSDLIATSTTLGKQICIGKQTTQAQSPYSQTIQLRLNQIAGMRELHSGSELHSSKQQFQAKGK